MAIDTLARGLAANAGGGGGGVVDVNISGGTGIDVKQTGDDVTISNTGVTNVTDADPADDGSTLGTVKVVIAGDSKKTKHVKVRGLDNAAYKDVDTVVDNTTKDSEKLPTTKAVKTALDKKIDSTAKGANSGVASLDATGKVPTTQMPTATTSAVGAVKIGDNISVDNGTISVGTFVGSGDKAKAGLVPKPGDTAGTTKYLREDGTWTVPSDTHYTANAKVTASATGKANASATNGNVHLNLIENDTVRDSHNIVGTGATTVTSDADGKITINSTDTKYTADGTSGISVDATNKKISNTGVRGFVDSKTEDAAGTIRVNVNGTESLITPKGLKSGAFKGVDTTVSSTSTDDNVPTSKAVYTAVNAKLDANKVNVANGVAPLDGSKKVPLANLPTTDTYSATGTDPVSGKAVASAIGGLDVTGTTAFGAGKTISAWSETDGKISITSQNISITKSQVSDFPTSMTPTAHNQASNTINAMTGYSKATTASAISTSDSLNTAVGKLEKKVDDKVQKTEVSSSNETTSVINVTDAKAQMAMVAKISGKTVKKNLLVPNSDLSSKTENNVKFTPTFGSNGELLYITADGVASDKKATGNAVYVISRTVTSSVAGCIASALSTSVSGTKFVVELSESPWTSICVSEGSADKTIPNTFVSGKNYNFYIQVTSGTVVNNIKFYPMIRPAGTDATYQPPNTLWSAPVESVVSQGENICNVESPTTSSNTVLTAVNDNTFTLTSTGVWTTWNVECDVIPNKQYRINYNLIASTGSAGKLYVRSKDGSTNLLDIDFNTVGASTKTFTPTENKIQVRIYPNNSATSANYSKTFKLAVVPSTESGTVYPPYNKTTVLVPSEARNCVGYGLGIDADCCNVIDFENGVYTQKLGIIDLGTLSYRDPSNSKFQSTTQVPGIKRIVDGTTLMKGLCSKYTVTTAGSVFDTTDKAITTYDSYVTVRDTSYTSASALKSALSGVYLVYELASAVTTPLKDFIRPLPVEQGGTLTLVNEHNLDMPSVIKYKKEVN